MTYIFALLNSTQPENQECDDLQSSSQSLLPPLFTPAPALHLSASLHLSLPFSIWLALARAAFSASVLSIPLSLGHLSPWRRLCFFAGLLQIYCLRYCRCACHSLRDLHVHEVRSRRPLRGECGESLGEMDMGRNDRLDGGESINDNLLRR